MRKSRLIAILIASLCVTSVSALSLSIAWYVNGPVASVDGMNLTLKAEREIKISTSDELSTFKSEIPFEELNQIDGFVPITTMYSQEWLETKEITPHFKANPSYGGEYPTVSEAKGGYFCQELYMYSESNSWITIDIENTFFSGDSDKNMKAAEELLPEYPEKTLDQIFNELQEIKNTLRIAIFFPDERHELQYYRNTIVESNKTGQTYLAGQLDTNSDGYLDYYRKNGELYETCYGEVKDRSKLVYNEAKSVDTEAILYGKKLNAKHRAGVRTLNVEESLKNGADFGIEDSITPEEANQKSLLALRAYEPTKFYLSVYIEGWDVDTINSTMFASFDVSLQFKILKEMF